MTRANAVGPDRRRPERAAWRSLGLPVSLALALLPALCSVVWASGPIPERGAETEPGERLAISFVRDGTLARVVLAGDRLRAEDANGTPIAERALDASQRRDLLALARAALIDDEPRRSCDGEPHELTMIVAADGRSRWSAVCASPGAWYMHPERWWALRDQVRALFAKTRFAAEP